MISISVVNLFHININCWNTRDKKNVNKLDEGACIFPRGWGGEIALPTLTDRGGG
jgi:hypothetical protein